MEFLEKLSLAGLVPVIAVNDADDAVPLCKALSDGGLPVAEITFRTAAAEEAIRRVHEAMPDVLLCAGTVLTTEQVDRAVKAGAAAIVSPGLSPDVVKYCVEKNIPVCPGTQSPSEMIAAMTRSAVDKMLGFEVRHIGLNCPDAESSMETAKKISALMGWPIKEGNSSNFVGTGYELMKKQGRGTNGHIAIGTNSVPRAKWHLEQRGFKFIEDSAVVKNGKLIAIYLEDEIGGFAFHLVQK